MSKLATPATVPMIAESLSGDMLLVHRALAREPDAFRAIM
ncbi:RNA polymerase sigma factor, partial [Mesorhizobium sp. M8A.F.Ca.ET.023.02.2.1]